METQAEYELKPKEAPLPAIATPNDIILEMVRKGVDPEYIGKMMELAERSERNEARKAYHEAMAEFKRNPPEIEKDKSVGYETEKKGFVGYKHASLANVTTKINKALSEHGLSAGWHTGQTDKGITVTCTITHRQGHSESTSLTAAADTSGNKNAIQAIGSTVSYLERYTILALTGLATHDMDDDGKNSDIEYISEAQLKEINKLIKSTGAEVEAFLKYAGAESVETIPAKSYNKVLIALQQKAKKKPEREPGSDDK